MSTGYMLKDLAVGQEGGEWVVYVKHTGQRVQGGFRSREEANEYLHTTYDDCD